MKRIVLFYLALLLPIEAEQTDTASPAGGISLVERTVATRVEAVFDHAIKRDCPGCALGIWSGGRVVYTHGYGLSNLEYQIPVTPETIFEAGSVSKQFTAAAILLLAREGKLSLDDDVRKLLPEVPDFGARITIRHLLTHTSGLRDQWELLTLAGRPPGRVVHTPEEILYLVARQKELNFPPGEEYLYSNTGFTLLSWVVRRASGRSLAEFSQAEIFHPLGMARTRWRDDFSRIVKGRASAYRADAKGEFHTEMPFTNVYGNGGLLTTVGDLLIWSENFFHPRILGQPLIDQMQTSGKLNNGESIDYGLGLFIGQYRGAREISHSGSTAGYRAFLVRFPDQQTAIAVLCNSADLDPSKLARQVADIVLADTLHDPEKPKTAFVAQEELARRMGLYWDSHSGELLRLQLKAGRLYLTGAGPEIELVPVSHERFLLQDSPGEIVFAPESKGKPAALNFVRGQARSATYLAVRSVSPSRKELEAFRGDYHSEELGVACRIEIYDGKLTMWHPPEAPVILEPAFADAFTDARHRVFCFRRGSTGTVDGFRANTGRVRHLLFVKRTP